jgi:hypothetical protein
VVGEVLLLHPSVSEWITDKNKNIKRKTGESKIGGIAEKIIIKESHTILSSNNCTYGFNGNKMGDYSWWRYVCFHCTMEILLGGTQRLTRCVGIARAKEMIFTAEMINGKSAQLYALVNHCVQQNQYGDAAYHKALDIGKLIIKNVRMSANNTISYSRGQLV